MGLRASFVSQTAAVFFAGIASSAAVSATLDPECLKGFEALYVSAKRFDPQTFKVAENLSEFESGKMMFKVLQRITPSKSVSSSDFQGYSGAANNGLEILESGGKKYFAKILAYTPEKERQVLNELTWTREMDRLGYGPRLVTSSPASGGNLRIITEFVDGVELHFGFTTSRSVISREMLDKAYLIGRELIEKGIYPRDLQFRVGKNGRFYVVDPALFKPIKSAEEKAKAQDELKRFYQFAVQRNR